MSESKKDAGGRKKVWVGGVARRPAAEVVEEMEVLAREDRRALAAPIPLAPRPPGRFYVTRRPPLPSPPPINPYVPDTPDRARLLRAAAISARARQDIDDVVRPLLEEADAAAAAPKKASPPRDAEDHYDLARWARRRWL